MSIPIKTTDEMLADFRASQFPDRRQLAADYDALAARLASAERLLEIVAPIAYRQWVAGEAVGDVTTPTRRTADSADASRCPMDERAEWGECPVCHAPHGERCRPVTVSPAPEVK